LARNVSAAQRTPSVTGFCRYRILMNADDNVVADSIDGFRRERETDLLQGRRDGAYGLAGSFACEKSTDARQKTTRQKRARERAR